MKKVTPFWPGLILTMTTLACGLFSPSATPTPTLAVPSPTSLPPTNLPPTIPPPSASPTPETPQTPATATTTPIPEPSEPEAILILEPGPGSRLSGDIHISGEANPTFEQNLVIRVISADGAILFTGSTTIQADVGQRGPFTADLAVDLPASDQEATLQVYSDSARDGGITHLSSVGVILSPGGPIEIRPASPSPEKIQILAPAINEQAAGGTVHVEGIGAASFEQSLLIEVVDGEGRVVGVQPVIVQAGEMGQPGPFSADVSYSLSAAGPGRVQVRDISPAAGQDLHIASVEVNLSP